MSDKALATNTSFSKMGEQPVEASLISWVNGKQYEVATEETIYSREAVKSMSYEINSPSSVIEYFIKFGVSKYNSSFFSRIV